MAVVRGDTYIELFAFVVNPIYSKDGQINIILRLAKLTISLLGFISSEL